MDRPYGYDWPRFHRPDRTYWQYWCCGFCDKYRCNWANRPARHWADWADWCYRCNWADWADWAYRDAGHCGEHWSDWAYGYVGY